MYGGSGATRAAGAAGFWKFECRCRAAAAVFENINAAACRTLEPIPLL